MGNVAEGAGSMSSKKKCRQLSFEQGECYSVRLSCAPGVGRKIVEMLESGSIPEDMYGSKPACRIVTPSFRHQRDLLESLIEGKKFDEAIELAESVLTDNPRCSIAYDAKGIALFEKCKLIENGREELLDWAISSVRVALELNPNEPTFWAHLSAFELEQGLVKSAVSHAKKAITLNGADGFCWANLGMIQYYVGQMDHCIQSFEFAEKLGYSVPALSEIRNALSKRKPTT
jgi:tetratricopeptide (TPR) repeat protein